LSKPFTTKKIPKPFVIRFCPTADCSYRYSGDQWQFWVGAQQQPRAVAVMHEEENLQGTFSGSTNGGSGPAHFGSANGVSGTTPNGGGKKGGMAVPEILLPPSDECEEVELENNYYLN
jgi:hypothetical protein